MPRRMSTAIVAIPLRARNPRRLIPNPDSCAWLLPITVPPARQRACELSSHARPAYIEYGSTSQPAERRFLFLASDRIQAQRSVRPCRLREVEILRDGVGNRIKRAA